MSNLTAAADDEISEFCISTRNSGNVVQHEGGLGGDKIVFTMQEVDMDSTG